MLTTQTHYQQQQHTETHIVHQMLHQQPPLTHEHQLTQPPHTQQAFTYFGKLRGIRDANNIVKLCRTHALPITNTRYAQVNSGHIYCIPTSFTSKWNDDRVWIYRSSRNKITKYEEVGAAGEPLWKKTFSLTEDGEGYRVIFYYHISSLEGLNPPPTPV